MAGIYGQKESLIHDKPGDIDGNKNIQGYDDFFLKLRIFYFKG